jgi:ferredoxin
VTWPGWASIWRARSAPAVRATPILGAMHITVDYELCEGHGQCLMAAPELFDLPDGADQVVVLDADPPESERDRAVRAAAMCPALAIKVS